MGSSSRTNKPKSNSSTSKRLSVWRRYYFELGKWAAKREVGPRPRRPKSHGSEPSVFRKSGDPRYELKTKAQKAVKRRKESSSAQRRPKDRAEELGSQESKRSGGKHAYAAVVKPINNEVPVRIHDIWDKVKLPVLKKDVKEWKKDVRRIEKMRKNSARQDSSERGRIRKDRHGLNKEIKGREVEAAKASPVTRKRHEGSIDRLKAELRKLALREKIVMKRQEERRRRNRAVRKAFFLG